MTGQPNLQQGKEDTVEEPYGREQSLQEIGNIIAHWISWTEQERDEEGLETTPDTHVMLSGYDNAPPHWPSVGQLKCWLEVLHDARPQSTVTEEMIEALEFYADAYSWYGVYMVGGGPMAGDWSDDCACDDFPDGKPGKRARAALSKIFPLVEKQST